MKRKAKKSDEAAALESLGVMLRAIKRDAWQFFGMGKFSCKKKLANGAVVRFSITMPKLPAKSAQEQAVDDINSGRVEHTKHTCPGFPIH